MSRKICKGLTIVTLEISNPRKPELAPLSIQALADTRAVQLCLPVHIALQLQLETVEQKEVTLADGHKKRVPYVGPVEIRFANRTGFTCALILGDEPLLVALPQEEAGQDMDLVVHPRTRTVTVNPLNPNIAISCAK